MVSRPVVKQNIIAEAHGRESYSPHGSIKYKRKEGLESQCPFLGHAYSDQTSFH
jgi:hypothetical protein